jgi:hypothetical protein
MADCATISSKYTKNQIAIGMRLPNLHRPALDRKMALSLQVSP